MPLKPTYTVAELQAFIERDLKSSGKRSTIICYGGEPLVNKKFVVEMINNIDADFVLQTNGTLLSTLTKEELDKFTAVLVSIDGPPATVDVNRGKGTYERCIAGCKSALEKTRFELFYNTFLPKQILFLSQSFSIYISYLASKPRSTRHSDGRQ